jgi:hypothetical protein
MTMLKVGPIQKPKRPNPYVIIRNQAKDMKVGEFFEIAGVMNKADANNIRSTIGYFGKKDGFKVTTKVIGSKMTVEKIPG